MEEMGNRPVSENIYMGKPFGISK